MANEVTIVVKARSAVGGAFKAIRAESEREGDAIGRATGDRLSTGLSGRLLGTFSKIGDKLTEALGNASAKLPGIVGNSVSSLPPQGQALALAITAGLAVYLAPAIGAALGSAIALALGGGILAAGIASAARDPKVKAAFKPVAEAAKGVFADLGEPFRAPLERAAKTFTKALKDIKPDIKELGTIIAPVVDKLAPAFVGFLKAALPGLKAAAENAVPLFQTIADHLPDIGKALGDFFEKATSPENAEFLDDLLDTVEGLIVLLGSFIGFLGDAYGSVKSFAQGAIRLFTSFSRAAINSFGNVLEAATIAMGAINPLAAIALRKANASFKSFAASANAALDSIDTALTVTVTYVTRYVEYGLKSPSAMGGYQGFASGGIVGAAMGGIHSGLRLVGEHGPELAELPPGTRVRPTGETQRMLGGNVGDPTEVIIKAARDADSELMAAIMKKLRLEIRRGGGSVQQVLGKPGVA